MCFTPPLLPGLSVFDGLKNGLSVSFSDRGQAPDGRIDFSHISHPPAEQSPISYIDITPSNLVALRNYLAGTGDWAFFQERRESILKAVRFLMSMDRDGDGILESPFHGNHFAPGARNWWDDFAFGHKDGYLNLLSHRALRGMEEIFAIAGMEPERAEVAGFLARFRSNFRKVFFNPDTGVYGGWISRDGRMHDAWFTFINAQAILEGRVEKREGMRIMKRMLKKAAEQGYDFTYGIPGNLVSVAKADMLDWEPMVKWGIYENGGLCGQPAYFFIQALYEVGLRREADRILFRMIETFETGYTHSGIFPGLFKSIDWRTKEGVPCGYNYLADNYYFLLAAITGHFRIPLPPVPPLKRTGYP